MEQIPHKFFSFHGMFSLCAVKTYVKNIPWKPAFKQTPQLEEIIAEELVGLRKGRSTTALFNLLYLQHQQNIHDIYIHFKKAFGSVWCGALWTSNNL